MVSEWYKHAWRRNVVDTHIDDWDETFLSRLDPADYVQRLRDAGVESAVVYAHSHVGHSNYPTKVGHMHPGLNGRDVFGEILELCHRHGIKVVAYYSLIYNNWVYARHPDWRMTDVKGNHAAYNNRYGVCCPNSPYRDYIEGEIREICENYEFGGLRYDMCFWPLVCFCEHCMRKFRAETGDEIPRVIDWENPVWVRFQRCRERWLAEFAELATNLVKKYKPGASVEHQSSTYPLPWQFGVTTELSRQCTFLQGDFYGGLREQAFVCKLLYNLTPNRPAGYETSIAGAISVHASYKPEELLRAQVFSALSNGAAFIFIDGVDPVGTLNPAIYKKMGAILDETRVYDAYRGGEMCQDIAVYLSTESKYYAAREMADRGLSVFDDPESHASEREAFLSRHDPLPHVENVINIVESLIHRNVLFGVITKENLSDLGRYKVIVLSNVKMMNPEEAAAIREYVRQGGCVYASRYTSLYPSDGTPKSDFQLGDVFGVSYRDVTVESVTYMAPTDETDVLFAGYSRRYPLSVNSTQTVVKAAEGTRVLATTTLPYTDPKDPTKFVSIHCNPPGIATENPAVVMNTYGRGRTIYATAELENQHLHRDLFWKLLRELMPSEPLLESDAPKPVEFTVFVQEEQRRYIVNICNFQKDLPGVAVHAITVKLHLGKKKAVGVKHLPDESEVDCDYADGVVEFAVPRLDVFEMYAVCYE